VAFIIVVCALCAVAALARPVDAKATTRGETRLLHVINDVRAAHGLRRLRLSSTLESGSHYWARYLRIHDTFQHARLASGTAENIGWLTCRDGWARTLTRMWLNSYTHRIHLLDRGARVIGVGVSTGRWSGWSCVKMSVTRFR
jgi:uncharacterized protein YkwD